MSDDLGERERAALAALQVAERSRRRDWFARLEQIAELERLGVVAATGHRSLGGLVAELLRVTRAEATRLVAETHDLTARTSLLGQPLPPRYPATAAGAAAGDITPAQVGIIRRTMRRLERVDTLTPDVIAAAEAYLAAHAARLGPGGLDRAAAELLARLDPDGTAPDDLEDHRDELRLTHRRDGTLLLRGAIHDPTDAALLQSGFDAGSAPAGPHDDRPLERRQAAALKEFVADALSPSGLLAEPDQPTRDSGDGDTGDTDTEDTDDADAEHDAEPEAESDLDALIPEPRRPESSESAGTAGSTGSPSGPKRRRPVSAARALLTLTIDHQWLRDAIGHGTLDDDTPVHIRTLRRLACDAEILPAILGTRSEPLDVGRLQRSVTDALRRALNIRDRGCAFPDCTRGPRRCHAHHIDHWEDGGPTEIHNLVLLCLYHHQLIHHGHWTVAITDGLPWFTPPWYIDTDHHPIPGGPPRVPL
ncbi:HNH endonuclease signature motif containing protein [Actinomycetospora sp. NBRC 106375]|uniref:HNH endonuclease signature motif containing protein n=1 Tax=Actinomycetospora sp. NBRC 106375 TaxID=3032207 RepID=UPI0025539C3D|nr:HNH endonuclease signature motif containing protein [Actinomycetospora sp. NBRC 106375]